MKDKIVTFDFWDTLYEEKKYKEKRIIIIWDYLNDKKILKKIEEVKVAYQNGNEYVRKCKKISKNRNVGAVERLTFIFKCMEINIGGDDIQKLLIKFQNIVIIAPPFISENCIETLNDIHNYAYLGIISDTGFTMPDTICRLLSNDGILKLFSFKIFSEYVGYNKPDNKMFIPVLNNKYSINRDKIIHVGDNWNTDIIGAIQSGLTPIYYNSNLKCDEEKYIVKNWGEISNECKKIFKL